MGQLVLGQCIEHIALVLLPVLSPQQQPSPLCFIKLHIGIMAGSNIIAAHFLCPGKQLPQLHMFVAIHAGIRRAPLFVFFNKMAYDAYAEVFAEIKYIMGKAHLIRYQFRIRCIGKAAVFLQPQFLVVKHLQRNADDIITGLLQQQGSRTAVHPAAHGHQHFFPVHNILFNNQLKNYCFIRLLTCPHFLNAQQNGDSYLDKFIQSYASNLAQASLIFASSTRMASMVFVIRSSSVQPSISAPCWMTSRWQPAANL